MGWGRSVGGGRRGRFEPDGASPARPAESGAAAVCILLRALAGAALLNPRALSNSVQCTKRALPNRK